MDTEPEESQIGGQARLLRNVAGSVDEDPESFTTPVGSSETSNHSTIVNLSC